MKKYLLIIFVSLLSCNLFAQPFQIGHATITLTDASRNNRAIATEIYYPADLAGNNVPVTTANNDKFPLISFGHGFVMGWDAYENIWTALVPNGYIVAFPKTEGSIVPSHTEFGKDLAFVISEITAIGLDTTSLFFNRVDTMNCVMGHSMGGGSAFLSTQYNPLIKTIAVLAPAETNPSAIQAAATVFIPSLIIAGENDCVTPPATNQIPMYDSLQSNCKTYISIIGGSHCQMAENNFLCSFGEATCSPQPTITRAEQHTVVNRFLIPWLEYQLKDDCLAGAQFDSLVATDTSIVFEKTCLLCITTEVKDIISPFNVTIFPSPFNDKLYVELYDSADKIAVDLFSIDGRKVFSQIVSNERAGKNIVFNIDKNLPAGIYLLKMKIDENEIVRKLIKQ